MTEAPETIWAWKWNTPAVKSHGKPAWSDFEPVFDDWVLRGLPTKKEWLGKKEIYKTAAVEYRRADLPATDAQVKAALTALVDDEDVGNWSQYKWDKARAALAAMKK